MTKKEQDLITKAEILFDYSQFLKMFKKEDKCLGHIYILRHIKGDDSADDWAGKINSINNLVKSTKKKVTDDITSVKADIQKVKSSIKDVKTDLKKDLNDIKEAIQELSNYKKIR